MYLLTTAARSTRYSTRPSREASTRAASVLPVPLGPWSSTRTPRCAPRRACARRTLAVAAALLQVEQVEPRLAGTASDDQPPASGIRTASTSSASRGSRR